MENAIQSIKNMIFPTSDPYKLSGQFGDSILEPTVAAALRVLHETPSEFNTAFFSKKNIDFIQGKLISQTKRYTGVDIGRQNDDELVMMMCGIYVQDSTFNGNVQESLKKINTIVITECLKQILPGVRSYVLYLRDASMPFGGGGENAFARPQDVSEKGTKVSPGFLPLERNAK